jgi:hypothetical protein
MEVLTAGTESGSFAMDLLGSAVAAGLESQEGWNIGTELTLRILDVETGLKAHRLHF